jgi:RsmE family RNA methyltransferase
MQEVHRAQVGDTLRVGVVNGLMGTGRVESIGDGEVVLEVELTTPPPPPLTIELLLAVPRPKILKKVVPAVTSMGVKRIVLVNSARVDKSYFTTPFLRPEGMRELLTLGLEQARDTVLPEVLIRERFRPFIEDEVEQLWPQTKRLLAHPGAPTPIERLEVGATESTVVAIGPEGGWVPFEVELMEKLRFQGFSLGERILRVDTAVPSIVSQLDLLRRCRSGGP